MRRPVITLDMKIGFNDICMREMGLELAEDSDRLCSIDENTDTIEMIMYNEKYIKYSDEDFIRLRNDEIEMDLIRNPRIMETLAVRYIEDFANRKGIYITSHYQSALRGLPGFAAITYKDGDVTKTMQSDLFINESVRTLNLICKLNNTTHMYDFKQFDIIEVV